MHPIACGVRLLSRERAASVCNVSSVATPLRLMSQIEIQAFHITVVINLCEMRIGHADLFPDKYRGALQHM